MERSVTVQHYELLEKLGSGGMGEIYRAQDTRLKRSVAIKVLLPNKAQGTERRRRFIQEAQAASALNHPNIITIHDIIYADDVHYLVMEHISGKTLLELIPHNGLPVPQVLQYATQMADALSVAHAAGIIHRDFKPANVMITRTGLVKVLDFGLAKLTDQSASQGSSSAAAATAGGSSASFGDQATLTTSPLTVEGSILGTVNYMSPEQAEGKKVDSRSDIFSFGAVLYEMVTGHRAFDGNSTVSTLTAILRDEVKPLRTVAPSVPPELVDVINRCLRKDPHARWQSMREVELALGNLKRRSESGVLYQSEVIVNPELTKPDMAKPVSVKPALVKPQPLPPAQAKKQNRQKLLVFGLAGVAVLAVVVVVLWTNQRQSAPKPVAQVSTPAPAIQPPPAEVQPPAAETPAPVAPPAPEEVVLTNDTIAQMVQDKAPDADIVARIRASKTKFDLSADEVSRLTKAGASRRVIAAMRNPTGAAVPPSVASAPAPAASKPGPTTQETAAAKQAPKPPVAKNVPTIPSSLPTSLTPSLPAPQLVTVTLKDAVPFRVALVDDVPVEVEEGQAVQFRVLDGVEVDNIVVIAKGSTVTGAIVSETGKKKFLGMGGGGKAVMFRLLNAVSVEDAKIAVRSTAGRKADAPAGRSFETKGGKAKDLIAARGTEYIAYIDGEQSVSVHK